MELELVLESTTGWAISPTDGRVDDFRGYRCAYRLDGERRWRGFTLEASPFQSVRDAVIAALAVVNAEAIRRELHDLNDERRPCGRRSKTQPPDGRRLKWTQQQ